MNNTTEIQKASPFDAGCWIDGHWGQYGVTRLIDIAKEYGMILTEQDQQAIDFYNAGEDMFFNPDGEQYTADWVCNQGGIGDDAEQWLNDHVAPEGYSFSWHDGEFFLWSTEEQEENG